MGQRRQRNGLGPGGDLLAVALIVGAGLAVFGQVIDFGFVDFDDNFYVENNPVVRAGLTVEGLRWAFGVHQSNWHPLTWLSLMLDAQLGGVGARTYHLTNVILHSLNGVLLFWFLRRTTQQRWTSMFAALLFAIHPLHVESVAWVAERKDVLSTAFGFLCLLAYAAWARSPTSGRYALVVASFAAGLMAKPMLVTLPVVLLVLDVWPLGRLEIHASAGPEGFARLWRAVREKLPLFALSGTMAVITLLAQKTGGAVGSLAAFPFPSRLANAIIGCNAYVIKMVWPTGLAVFYPYPERIAVVPTVAGALALSLITFGALKTLRARPYIFTGWTWYLVTLLPVIGLIQVGLQARADRYTYVPLVGLFLVVCWGARDLTETLARSMSEASKTRALRAMGAVAGLAIVLLAVTARRQVAHWRDGVSLFSHTVEVTTDNATGYANLGQALLKRGDVAGAIRHARRALEIDPSHPEAPVVLANGLVAADRPDEAIEVYRRALEQKPGHVLFRTNYGVHIGQRGDLGEAERQFRRALELDPDYYEACYNFGIVLARQQRFEEAIPYFERALRTRPLDRNALDMIERIRALQTTQQP